MKRHAPPAAPIAGRLRRRHNPAAVSAPAIIPIPAAADLYDGPAPADRIDGGRRRPFRGWKRLDGSAPGWALGDVALVADYGDAPNEWIRSEDPATGDR